MAKDTDINAELIRVIRGWLSTYSQFTRIQTEIGDAQHKAAAALRKSISNVHIQGNGKIEVLPATRVSVQAMSVNERFRTLSSVNFGGIPRNLLERFVTEAPKLIEKYEAGRGFRGFWAGKRARSESVLALASLNDLRQELEVAGFPSLSEKMAQAITTYFAIDAPAPNIDSVAEILGRHNDHTELDADIVESALSKIERVEQSRKLATESKADAIRIAGNIVDAQVRSVLAETPIDALRAGFEGNFPLNKLREAGLRSALDILDISTSRTVPGVRRQRLERIAEAAGDLYAAEFEARGVRIDLSSRSEDVTELLAKTWEWADVKDVALDSRFDNLVDGLVKVRESLKNHVTRLYCFGSPEALRAFRAEADELSRVDLAGDVERRAAAPDVWKRFESDSIRFFTYAEELGILDGASLLPHRSRSGSSRSRDQRKSGLGTGTRPPRDASDSRPGYPKRGRTADLRSPKTALVDVGSMEQLPADILAQARDVTVDCSSLDVPLRRYQYFCAQFILSQKRVIIGDEMGLGKTIEALAVIGHLAAQGKSHILVICPASLVPNWAREILRKTDLPSFILGGPKKQMALDEWSTTGGVAIISFNVAGWFVSTFRGSLDCVVVDEAHYVKNPEAARTGHVRSLLGVATHAVLMTGTPLENSVVDLKVLVEHIRPDLLTFGEWYSVDQIRAALSRIYLRRKQSEVLRELPELIQNDELIPFSEKDAAAYRLAAEGGFFADLRRAAYRSGGEAMKVKRVLEIVAEAEQTDQRVIIFSEYLHTLDTLETAIGPERIFGRLQGGVSAPKRAEMVEDFSEAPGGTVLLAQIMSGGVGLNIVGASVVILAEPQWKPSTENQAIKRAHRMGQLRRVSVYRLISEEGVDRFVASVSARKQGQFDFFVDKSDLAALAPEARDGGSLSDADIAKLESGFRERERIRLGISAAAN